MLDLKFPVLTYCDTEPLIYPHSDSPSPAKGYTTTYYYKLPHTNYFNWCVESVSNSDEKDIYGDITISYGQETNHAVSYVRRFYKRRKN